MNKLPLNLPITIEDPLTGAPHTVKTVRQAQSALHRNWPNTLGSRYRAAEAACDGALHGDTEVDNARRAFIEAAIESHLHLR